MANSVQHNLSAINANRNFGITKGVLKSSTEKLSSGYKINRAADDAAGLSISEKMRRQIRGLTQASANAQDGISSVQTAEGALTEVHSMLQRLDELATKASNGSLSENDRQYVQDEVDQLLTEIDRVSETTKFNETYLLKGNTDKTTSDKFVNAHDAGLAGTLVDNKNGTYSFKVDNKLEKDDTVNIAGKTYTIGDAASTSSAGANYDTSANVVALTGVKAGDTFYDSSTDTTYTAVDRYKFDATKVANGDKYVIDDVEYTVDATPDGTSKVHKDDMKLAIAKALEDGKTVRQTYAGATGIAGSTASAVDVEIVDSLSSGEVSAVGISSVLDFAKVALNDSTLTALDEEDSVNLSGKTYTVIEGTSAQESSAVKEAIGYLGESSTVAIADAGGAAKTYTVAAETDAANGKFTIADIQAMVKEFDEITITANNTTDANRAKIQKALGLAATQTNAGTITAFTVVPNAEAKSSDVISASQAYKMMADELQKASSIGTDKGKEASVIDKGNGEFTITQGSVKVKDSLSFNLHVGADADMTNKIGVSIDTMDSAGLGLKGLDVVDKDGMKATYAIDSIEDAIKKVSTQRSALGAAQNRLEHTIKNLDNIVENTTAAEQEIRDTDMATEMVKFSNANILAQAGQSMLAQANQSNQGILSLLG